MANDRLGKFLDNMKGTMRKDEVVEYFDRAVLAIKNEVLPMVAITRDSVKDINVGINDITPIKELKYDANLTSKTPEGVFSELYNHINTMYVGAPDVKGMIKADLPDIITKESITVKSVALLEIVHNYNDVVTFTPDYIRYVIHDIDKKLYGKDAVNQLKPYKVSEIREGYHGWSRIISYYNKNGSDFTNKVKKLPTEIVGIVKTDVGLITKLMSPLYSMGVQGFVGSPFYHIGVWYVERQAVRYENLKDKRNEIELTLMDLKTRNNESSNPNLQKQIKYYEEKIEKTETKIRKLEGLI